VIMPNFWYILGGFCKQRVYIWETQVFS
jgi:hypothetical protein